MRLFSDLTVGGPIAQKVELMSSSALSLARLASFVSLSAITLDSDFPLGTLSRPQPLARDLASSSARPTASLHAPPPHKPGNFVKTLLRPAQPLSIPKMAPTSKFVVAVATLLASTTLAGKANTFEVIGLTGASGEWPRSGPFSLGDTRASKPCRAL